MFIMTACCHSGNMLVYKVICLWIDISFQVVRLNDLTVPFVEKFKFKSLSRSVECWSCDASICKTRPNP